MGHINVVVTPLREGERAGPLARTLQQTSHSTSYYESLDSLWQSDEHKPRVIVVKIPEEDPEEALRQHEFANANGFPVAFCYCVSEVALPFVVRAVRLGAIEVFDEQASSHRLDDVFSRASFLVKARQEQLERIRKARSFLKELSQRQRDILQILLQGYTNKATAAELDISVKTVEKHRQNMIRKARVGNILEIADVFAWSQRSISETSAYVPLADSV